MSRATLVVLALLAVTALAGCSKAPPSGELAPGASAVTVEGAATAHYKAAQHPVGQAPMACNPVAFPPVGQCVPASSSFVIHFMALPTPDGTYEVVLANATGTLPVGALAMDANNMWELNKTFDGKDYTGDFDRVELRMGDFVFATSAAGEGDNAFALADGLATISATGTYRGKVLNVTVSNLPAMGAFVGRLYTHDEASGLLTVAETFPLHNGANEFTAPQNIAAYAEFHIHAGASLINLYKTTVG
ncbi:MAG: hypothetical protein QOC71_162, partial [Thermoplasmata archaeon]|nr:hypothetical protein [Thermoplasmata archaeon]